MSGLPTDRLSRLTARPKGNADRDISLADGVGDRLGFVDRSPPEPVPRRKKPGRKRSPRTGQLHPKVMPGVANAIADEAERLGVTQGILIELMWSIYQQQGGGNDQ